MDTKETSYSQMVTVTRLNYRSDCNFTAGWKKRQINNA